MADIKTAEQLAQRALDVSVIDHAQLQGVWSELGSTNAPLGAFQQALLRREIVTQYQLEKLMKPESRTGFFYGDYKVLYCVGAGTFARVFRAVHRETGKMFAVKVLRSSLSNPKGIHPKTHKALKPYIDLFRREGEFGMKLKHPEHRRDSRSLFARHHALHRDGLRRRAKPARVLPRPAAIRSDRGRARSWPA